MMLIIINLRLYTRPHTRLHIVNHLHIMINGKIEIVIILAMVNIKAKQESNILHHHCHQITPTDIMSRLPDMKTAPNHVTIIPAVDHHHGSHGHRQDECHQKKKWI